jgi:hypothetical protein
MSQKRHTVDQIVAKLRDAEIEPGKGKKVPEVCKCGSHSIPIGVKKVERTPRPMVSWVASATEPRFWVEI